MVRGGEAKTCLKLYAVNGLYQKDIFLLLPRLLRSLNSDYFCFTQCGNRATGNSLFNGFSLKAFNFAQINRLLSDPVETMSTATKRIHVKVRQVEKKEKLLRWR